MEDKELIEEFEKRATLATPGPWSHAKHDSDFGGDYTSGYITSPHHTYRGNVVSEADRITDPSTMTFDDGEYLELCSPENILRLVGLAKRAAQI